MISMSSISSAGGTSKYMTEQAVSEYYAGEAVPSKWQGQGAEIQGLAGREVTGEALTQQLEGKVNEFNRDSGQWEEKQLGVMRGGELKHRAGWDLTFSAPKSVSIESEIFDNKDVRAAHEYAVGKAMEFLEDKAAQTRVNGEFVQTKNMTYATFEHATSRSGDPQTHTHVIVSAATFHDGKAYSLSNEKLMDYRTTADAVYKNELANSLEKAGYQVEWQKEGKNYNFEIVGYSKENLETFSKRSEEIKGALADHGMDKDTASYAARQTATLDTRADKNHPESADAHRTKWQDEAQATGVKQAEHVVPQERSYGEQMQSARDAVTSAINHLSEREAAFSDRDLWKEAARFSQGSTDTNKLFEAIREQTKEGSLIQRDDGKLTTREAVEAEKTMGERLSAGQGAHESVMTGKEFDKALAAFEERKGFALTGEQRDAARMILTGDDRFQGVQGLAGTGKTTMLEFVREAAESKGWEVRGFSNGGAQADKMQQESSIQSTTTAAHLIDRGNVERDANLAQRALDTLEKNSGVFGQEPNWRDLNKQVDKGHAKLEFDSEKRAYITDKNGDTWTKGLYERTSEISSKNINHLGATDTKYVVSDKGVFKSGGSPVSELAGHLKDKVHDATDGKHVAVAVAGRVAEKILGTGENWEKCGAIEAAAVRVQAAGETTQNRESFKNELKDQAAQANGETRKVLNLCDEAGMSGQREFNRVISATEKEGSRAVFLGDEKQRQGIDAGNGFELAQNHMPTAKLEFISRQTTVHMKDAVSKIVNGNHGEAVKGLETKEIRPNQQAVEDKYAGRENMTSKETSDRTAERKEASKNDNKEVIKELAKDYSSLGKGERDKTLVITSSNEDRRAINSEVRDNLKAKGELQDGKQINTLSATGLTKEDSKRAVNYQKGQVVEFTKDYRSQGIERGMQGHITGTDSRTNTISMKMDDGRTISFNPEKLQGKELFNEQKGKEFAVGDKVAITKNDGKLDVKNGQTGTVEKFDGKYMTVKMEDGQIREFNTQDNKHIDHAYAVTSHKSQGQTVDKVMVHHNSDKAGLHNQRETYVNITRAREDVTYYTQDINKAAKQAGVKMDKESATGQSKESDKSDKSSGSVKATSKSSAKEASRAGAEMEAGR